MCTWRYYGNIALKDRQGTDKVPGDYMAKEVKGGVRVQVISE